MARIDGSVGQGGDNAREDVLEVQRLLNRHELSPLQRVPESGTCDSLTVSAIRHFQARYVGMGSPDGRVDPGGRTLRRLESGGGGAPLPRAGSSPETREADREARKKLVGPSVRETAATARIIDALLPHLARTRARIISGYLSDAELFWKVNYHWAYLLDMVDHCARLALGKDVLADLSSLRAALLGCAPDPATGYLTSPLGKPEDRSSMEQLTRRHKLVSQAKKDFKKLTEDAGLKEKSRRTPKAFDYAVAPVSHPGTSKHGSGYALDIEGDNADIASTCKRLGATLVFDEKSHVHVEFRNGVAGA